MPGKIKMYTIHSTKAAKIGWYWDETIRDGIAIVEFHNRNKKAPNGPRYMYFPVSQEKFGEVFKAKSKGAWITSELINNKSITCQKINQPKLNLK